MFLSVDPLVGETHAPYGYAGQDPINEDDPSGLAPTDLPNPFGFTVTWPSKRLHFGQIAAVFFWSGAGPLFYTWYLENRVGRSFKVQLPKEEAAKACPASIAPCINVAQWKPDRDKRIKRVTIYGEHGVSFMFSSPAGSVS